MVQRQGQGSRIVVFLDGHCGSGRRASEVELVKRTKGESGVQRGVGCSVGAGCGHSEDGQRCRARHDVGSKSGT